MSPLERVAAWADEAEAADKAKNKNKAVSSNGFDLQSFMTRHGLEVRKEKPWPEGGTLYELTVCPFDPSHKGGGAFITQQVNGALGFRCHHTSCAGRGWKELRSLLEPGYEARKNGYHPIKNIGLHISNASAQFDKHQSAETPVGVPDLLNGYDPQDVGNAQRFIAMWGDKARWCPELNKWLFFDGTCWKTDAGDQVRIWMHQTAMEFGIQAIRANNEVLAKFAAGCRRTARITNALREAQPHLAISAAQLDTDPFLLNFRNGTVGVRTGELMEHNADHFITKVIEYDYIPSASCPRFLKFLQRITGGRPDASKADNERSARLMGYLQIAFGYSLTGITAEKAVFLLYGPTDNGKSTLLVLFLTLLGPYAVLIQIESLMARQQETNNAQADLADLNGARFVMTSETEEDQRLSEGKLKRITQGTGKIKAVRKYENPIEFPESHKLWIDCNFLPVIRGYDEAIWRRLRTIPLKVVIPKDEQDKTLSTKLLEEAEGILAWAVAGAVEWYQHGLPTIPEIEQVTQDWRKDADQVGRFINACCVVAPNARTKARVLYAAYTKWCEDSGEHAVTEKKFSERIREREFQRDEDRTGRIYLGIGLRVEG